MIKRIGSWLLCAVGALSAASVTLSAGQLPAGPLQSTAAAAPGPRFILRARGGLVAGIAARHALTVVSVLRDDGQQTLLVEGPAGMVAADFDAEMDADGDVIACEPERGVRVPELAASPTLTQSASGVLDGIPTRTLVSFFGSPSPSNYVTQPATALIRLAESRQMATGDGVVVAIIDTGVDEEHPLLGGVVLPGYDFTRNLAGPASDLIDLNQSTAAILEQSTAAILEQQSVVTLNQSTAAILEQSTAAILEGLPPLPSAFGHGTMVAGLVHLVAPTARILPLKAFNADGTSKLSDIIRAIYYAVDNGAKVINMSFSLTDISQELMRAVNYATAHGVICVASVGNQGRETMVFPAAYRNVISVASTNNLDQRSLFSNYGDAVVHLAAPGEALMTTYPGGHYASVAGTSFSAALVSGGVALMVDEWAVLTPRQAADAFSKSQRVVGSSLGLGRLDLLRALAKIATLK